MADQNPRQPKDMKGLLKFCLEATKEEDAPAIPDNPDHVLNSMDPQRREWLEDALKGMSVDIIEQLANGIKILMSDSTDLDEKEETLDSLEDWLGNIDMAMNFHKIGGFSCLKKSLISPHPSLRTGSAHLIAEISQNNEYCQDKFIKEGFLDLLCKQLEEDSDEACRVKALYSISCLCRDYPPGHEAFSKLDGWSIVVRAILSNIPKLRTKGCFFLGVTCSKHEETVIELTKMGLVQQLVSILQDPLDLTHEHVLVLLVTLIQHSEAARSEAFDPALGIEGILKERLTEGRGKEEYMESCIHINNLIKLCSEQETSSVNTNTEFIPSNDWKEIQPNQAIPGGLHVRINLETGKKEAKLLQDNKTEDEETADR